MKKNRKRILMISSSSKIGGGTKHMFILGKKINSEFEVFYAIPHNNNFSNFLNKENHFPIPERKINFFEIIKLRKFINNQSIDIIHAHGKGAAAIARLSAIFLNKKIIYTFHGIHLQCHSFISKIIYIVFEFVMGRIDSHKIFVSKSEKKYAKLSKIFIGKNNSIITNGVKTRDIKVFSKKNKIEKNDIFSNLNVISVCRFEDQKNIVELMQIAEKLKEYNFILIGEGSKWHAAKKYIHERSLKNIFLLGTKKNVFYYLKKSDVYLSTSLYEGLPISIIEAMSIGLPIIASNVTGNCDVVIHGKTGYLYELGDIDMALTYLKKILNSDQLRYRLGKNSYEIQRTNFSLEKMINEYKNLYEKFDI